MKKRIRTGVICLHEGKLLCIELEDPTSRKRFWSLPGGAVEQGETVAEGAIRETMEETGYKVSLTSDVFTNQYLFRWNASIFDCTTHWFRAELADSGSRPAIVDDADYLLQAAWLSWPRCRELFLYNRGLREALNHFLPIRSHHPAG